MKPTVLTLIFTALFTTAAWSLGAIDPDAVCTDEADSAKDELEQHGEVVPGPAPDSEGDGSESPIQELRFGYDLVDESRMH